VTSLSDGIGDGEMRRANAALNCEEFRTGALMLHSRPQVVFVELTENCNLHCVMCRSAGRYDPSKNMDRSLFDRVAADLFDYAAIVDLRGWGESTILKDFSYYFEETARYGCRPRIVTNLTVGNERLWRRLVALDALIVISFDAATPETFAALRPGARLDRILANAAVIVDECRALGRSTEGVYFNVVAQSDALEELPRIVDIAAEYGLKRVHLNPVTLDTSHPGHLSRHIDRVRRSLAAMRERSEATGIEITLGAALDESLAETGAAAKRCTHPWVYCLVNHAGRVGFCDHLIGAGTERYLLGDLREQTFEAIWNGQAYEELRRQHVAWSSGLDERFGECNWCYRNRYIDFEQMTIPEYAKLAVSCSRNPEHFAPPLTDSLSAARRLPVLNQVARSPLGTTEE
jgi:radical SAM protein with 4Fe4S-binding SPASM domain